MAEAESTLRAGLAALPDKTSLHHALLVEAARRGEAMAALDSAAALAPDDPRMAFALEIARHC